MNGIVPLHVHSRFSFMRGVPDVQTLVDAAVARGHRTIALTDTGGLYGLVVFLQAARAAGLAPLIGAEIDEGPRHGRATLLAASRAGYATLCRQVSAHHARRARAALRAGAAAREVQALAALPLGARLAADHADLVILTDAPLVLAALPRSAQAWIDLRSPAWRTDHAALRTLAREHHRVCVATHPAYFLDRADHAMHRLLRAIAGNTTLSRLRDDDCVPEDASLLDDEGMARRFPHHADALAATREIAARCAVTWEFGAHVTPGVAADAREAAATLRAHAYAGAVRRYGTRADGTLRADVIARLEHELTIIEGKDFAEYFLAVEDIVRQAPRTCGRGSAAASIVSFALGITNVDPLAHDLFFERFLNPGRTDPPDIDIDFAWDERDRVLDYIFERFGAGRAAMVANHVGFRARAAVREIAKVYGLPDGEIARVTSRLSQFWDSADAREAVGAHPLFRDLHLDPPWPEILHAATLLEGHIRHLSVHCGGVVLTRDAITHYSAVEMAPKGLPILQWEKDQTEDAGLVKIDILGNRSLAVIRDALASLDAQGAARIDPLRWSPVHDAATQALIAGGQTLGVFYVESPAMRQLLQKARTGDFEHLVVMSSLIRPAANKYITAWLDRLHGAPYVPLHPLVGRILHDTYGIMVYQEDVTKVAMALAGFDAVDGDGLRKALSKKRPVQTLRAYRQRFFEGARERGADDATIERIWDMILSFSGYSFCKPHSASYAMVSFQSAYLRAHFPATFMAAVLSNGGGFYATFAYVSEAKRMGLRMLPPDVNASGIAYAGDEAARTVRVGVQQIRGVSVEAMEAVLAARRAGGAFVSLDDLLARTAVGVADARRLVLSGACDALEPSRARPALLWELHLAAGPVAAHAAATHHAGARAYADTGTRSDARRDAAARPRRPRVAQASLFGDTPWDDRAVARPAAPDVGAYDEPTLLRLEVESLGFLLSRHPLTLYRADIARLRAAPGPPLVAARDLRAHAGRRVRTIGWYVTSKTVQTRAEEPMEFVSFEDTTALYETTFFPDAYRRFARLLQATRPYVLEAGVEEQHGAVSLTVEGARVLGG